MKDEAVLATAYGLILGLLLSAALHYLGSVM